MILVDTSIWLDHLRTGDARLSHLLTEGRVLIHPWVIGELAVGQWRGRTALLDDLGELPQAIPAMDEEVLRFIEAYSLYGVGIGYVDAGLLASTKLTPGASLWTRDKRLDVAAERLSIAAKLTH